MARTGPPPPAIRLEHPGVRMAAVVAGFHRDIAERLLVGARDRLVESGLTADHFEDFWVPGAFELPLAARTMALKRRYAAVIALGCVVRGETSHFDHICQAAAISSRSELTHKGIVRDGSRCTSTSICALSMPRSATPRKSQTRTLIAICMPLMARRSTTRSR